MSLADIMGAARLNTWAEVGLVISLVTFTGIVAWVFLRKKSSWEHMRHLPLDEDPIQTDSNGSTAQ